MAKQKPVVTWEHVLSTLTYVQELSGALIEVVKELSGVSSPPKIWPMAISNLPSLYQGCPPTPKGSGCPQPPPKPPKPRVGLCPPAPPIPRVGLCPPPPSNPPQEIVAVPPIARPRKAAQKRRTAKKR